MEAYITYIAYTRFGQGVRIGEFVINGKTYYIVINGRPFLAKLKDGSLYVDNKIALYTSAKKLLTPENFGELSEFRGSLLYTPTETEKIVTSDPIGTKRFDDGQSVKEYTVDLDGLIVRVLIVTAAVIDPSISDIGFKAGLEQPAIFLRYSYFFIGDNTIKVLNIGMGKAIAVRNEFFECSIAYKGKKRTNTQTGPATPHQVTLANAIRRIQPSSKYACPEKAIMFWSICVSRNIAEIYRSIGVELLKGTKFTAPMRDSKSKSNLAELVATLNDLSANGNPVSELVF